MIVIIKASMNYTFTKLLFFHFNCVSTQYRHTSLFLSFHNLFYLLLCTCVPLCVYVKVATVPISVWVSWSCSYWCWSCELPDVGPGDWAWILWRDTLNHRAIYLPRASRLLSENSSFPIGAIYQLYKVKTREEQLYILGGNGRSRWRAVLGDDTGSTCIIALVRQSVFSVDIAALIAGSRGPLLLKCLSNLLEIINA